MSDEDILPGLFSNHSYNLFKPMKRSSTFSVLQIYFHILNTDRIFLNLKLYLVHFPDVDPKLLEASIKFLLFLNQHCQHQYLLEWKRFEMTVFIFFSTFFFFVSNSSFLFRIASRAQIYHFLNIYLSLFHFDLII